MEKLSVFFLIIIVTYFIYSFIKSRPKEELKKMQSIDILEKKEENKYRPFVVAAITIIMQDRKHKIKKVLLTREIDERNSSWRMFGRQENMMNRMFFKRK